ncbi:MAG: MXAN_5187 C-terminal domain-containing protein [Nannocystales bacterium]
MATKVKREAPSSDLRAALDELEVGIESVRLAYEKYFGGIERVPPAKQRATLEKAMRNVETRGVTNTVIRFRLNGLKARFITYKHYWTRMENQLERGMSRRDLLRRRRMQASAPPPPEPEAPPAVAAEAEAAARKGPPPPPGKRNGRVPPADPAKSGIDPSHLRSVFKQLVLAKRAAGESTKGLTYQALVRKLTAEAPKLKRKHGCEKLQFSVSTRGGKVRLRSEPDG